MNYPTYTTTISDQASLYYRIADDSYFCNFIPVSNIVDYVDAHYVENNIRTIFFYPKWKYEEFHKHPNSTIAEAFRKGYEVVYDLDNTMEIYHWNRFSNQTITIDPRNLLVPDEMCDFYGYELELHIVDYWRNSMTFDEYFLELVARNVNATAVVKYSFKFRLGFTPFFGSYPTATSLIVLGVGNTFLAVNVPRAKPKSIVSILIDPFDMYTWITYLILILTMAISLALFGDLLGRRHVVEIVLELFMISLAGPSRAYGGSFENRIITVFCLMGIVLISSYQSLVISFMSFARYHPEINTLAEIQERCLFSYGDEARDLNFTTYPNDTTIGAGRTCIFEMGRDNEQRSMVMASKVKSICHTFYVEDSMHFRHENYRYADTKFFEWQLLYYVSPRLREVFRFHFHAIRESGIYDYHYNNKSQPIFHYNHDTFVDRVVKVGDLTLVWYAYACGNLLSVVSFVMETIIHNEVDGLSKPKLIGDSPWHLQLVMYFIRFSNTS
ncbi:uncharacterized protein LOC128712368 [Anopheles marshallii]|uniref:uncharacterized protein LOC128712368 n=1 Tax=Anopheles marshallii TaxID=1521116 RepID=UPI00237A65AD|nr:uncharacterized protein LOC128712368 [Anopheles marshallii]